MSNFEGVSYLPGKKSLFVCPSPHDMRYIPFSERMLCNNVLFLPHHFHLYFSLQLTNSVVHKERSGDSYRIE